MALKFITENLIDASHFDSATEQGGGYSGDFIADSGNTGALELALTGCLDDYTWSGTTDSAGTTTTAVDSALQTFGDDFFIGFTITVGGESQTVTDFAQATGTLTFSAMAGAVGDATAYDLERKAEDMDLVVEITTAGDMGTAEFKWSHDNGTTYLGRNDVTDENWVAETEIVSSAPPVSGVLSCVPRILALASGRVVAHFLDATLKYVMTSYSDDYGHTWSAPVLSTRSMATVGPLTADSGTTTTMVDSAMTSPDDTFNGCVFRNATADPDEYSLITDYVLSTTTVTFSPALTSPQAGNLCYIYKYPNITGGLVQLESGRVLSGQSWKSAVDGEFESLIMYSDDNGQTWPGAVEDQISNIDMADMAASGSTVVVVGNNDVDDENVMALRSYNGGSSWYSAVTIQAGDAQHPSVAFMNNGTLICVWQDDSDSEGAYEIKGKFSGDSGATWGSTFDIVDHSGTDLLDPCVRVGLDGTIYVAYVEDSSDKAIMLTWSTDNGSAWETPVTLKTVASVDLGSPSLTIMRECLACSYYDETNNDVDMVVRGFHELYSEGSNDIVTAETSLPMPIGWGLSLVFSGGAAVVGDKWSYESFYAYAMTNIIEDSPSQPWRSINDSIACEIILDLGGATGHGMLVDGLGFFNCNVRTLSFQMNDTDSWGSPSVDEPVSFDITTGGTGDAGSSVYCSKDTSLMENFRDHELRVKGCFIRITSGSPSGETRLILDNVGDYIFWASPLSATCQACTFAIFQPNVAHTFTNGTAYRYARLAIGSQETADGFYQIGSTVMGRTLAPSDVFSPGYRKDHVYDVNMVKTVHGGLVPISGSKRTRRFSLQWPPSESGRLEVVDMLDYAEGKNLVMVPDHSTLTDCFLVKLVSDATQVHAVANRLSLGITFQEIT